MKQSLISKSTPIIFAMSEDQIETSISKTIELNEGLDSIAERVVKRIVLIQAAKSISKWTYAEITLEVAEATSGMEPYGSIVSDLVDLIRPYEDNFPEIGGQSLNLLDGKDFISLIPDAESRAEATHASGYAEGVAESGREISSRSIVADDQKKATERTISILDVALKRCAESLSAINYAKKKLEENQEALGAAKDILDILASKSISVYEYLRLGLAEKEAVINE